MNLDEKIFHYKTALVIALSDKSNFENHLTALTLRDAILATPPDENMIEVLNGAKYVSIAQIEYLLDILFTPFGWSHEVVNTQVIANEYVLTSCLTCTCPLTGLTIKRAGVAADMIRMAKDADITDISKKIKNALKMDAPHAKSDALKNAAISLGEPFGRNLNRKSGVDTGRKMQKNTRVNKLPQPKKVELTENHKHFKECVRMVTAGEATILKLEERFIISDSIKNKIVEYAEAGQ